MKKTSFCALLLALCMLFSSASAKKLRTDIPDWTEETVKQYVIDYVLGDPERLEELLGMYTLQVRRYMPPKTYVNFLSELKWMTGSLTGFGDYECFEDKEHETKTHILRLDMEKVDLDLFFTHELEDNEITNIEFVPVAAASEEAPADGGEEQ